MEQTFIKAASCLISKCFFTSLQQDVSVTIGILLLIWYFFGPISPFTILNLNTTSNLFHLYLPEHVKYIPYDLSVFLLLLMLIVCSHLFMIRYNQRIENESRRPRGPSTFYIMIWKGGLLFLFINFLQYKLFPFFVVHISHFSRNSSSSIFCASQFQSSFIKYAVLLREDKFYTNSFKSFCQTFQHRVKQGLIFKTAEKWVLKIFVP